MFIGVPALWWQKSNKSFKDLNWKFDFELLKEGRFLGPRIGRTVYFLDFSDFLYIKKYVFLIYQFFTSTVLARTAFWGSLLTGLPSKF